MRFVYQSLRFQHLSSYVLIDGKPLQIVFQGGSTAPTLIRGMFSTDDAKVQRAMDNSPEYGKNWTRIRPNPDQVKAPVPEKVKASTPPPPPPPPVAPIPPPADQKPADLEDKPLVIASGVTGFQAARQYLKDNIPGVLWGDIQSQAGTIATAKANNIQFPDWIPTAK